jgi:hypothetical protein
MPPSPDSKMACLPLASHVGVSSDRQLSGNSPVTPGLSRDTAKGTSPPPFTAALRVDYAKEGSGDRGRGTGPNVQPGVSKPTSRGPQSFNEPNSARHGSSKRIKRQVPMVLGGREGTRGEAECLCLTASGLLEPKLLK